jgi:hypothetical protein
MPISQTVFINIVVKGGLGNAADVTGPLKNIQDEAKKTGTAIEQNMNSAFKGTAVESERSLKAVMSSIKAETRAKQEKLATDQAIGNQDDKFQVQTLSSLKRRQAALNELAQANGKTNATQIKELTWIENLLASYDDKDKIRKAAAAARAQKDEILFARTAADDVVRAEKAAIRKAAAAEKAAQTEINEQVKVKRLLAGLDETKRAQDERAALRAEKVAEKAVQTELKNQAQIINITANAEDKRRTREQKAEAAATKQAETQAAKAKRLAEELRTTTGFGNQVGEFILRQVNTILKALTSMIGVMAAFTLFITIPEMLAKGLLALAEAAITSADEVQKLQIAIAALIGSVINFGGSAEENFGKALKWSERVYLMQIKLAGQSLGTASDLSKGYQAFLSSGGQNLVKNLEEGVQLSALLSNATLTLTGGLQKERQLFSEQQAAIEGVNRAGSQLYKWIRMQVGDYNTWLGQIRQSKDGLEKFTGVLGPFVEAGKKQGETLTGIVTSITGMIEALNVVAIKAGAFKVILGYLSSVREQLSAVIRELTDMTNPMQKLSDNAQEVLNIFAGISAAISVVAHSLSQVVTKITGARDELTGFEAISQVVLYIAAGIATMFDLVAQKVGDVVFAFKIMATSKDSFKAFLELIALNSVRAAAGEDSFTGLLKKNLELAAKYAKETVTALRETFSGPMGPAAPAANVRQEFLDEQQERAMKRLRRDLEVLRAGENEILKIQIKQAEKAEELEVTFRNVPKHKLEALGIIKQITAEEIKQADIHFRRNVIRPLEERSEAAIASRNEFSAAQAKLASEEVKLNELYKTRGVLYDEALRAGREATATELRMNALKKIDVSTMELLKEVAGEIEVVELQRARDIFAINQFDQLNVQERQRLLELINQQYGKEEDLIRLKQEKTFETDYGELATQLEKVQGKFNEIMEIEAERAAIESKLRYDYRGQDSELQVLLELVAQIFGYRQRTIELEQQRNQTRILVDETRTTISDIKEAADAYIMLGDSSNHAAELSAALTAKIAANDAQLAKLRKQAEGASGTELKNLKDQIRELSRANLEAKKSLLDLHDPLVQLEQVITRGYYALILLSKGLGNVGQNLKAVGAMVYAQLVKGIGSAITQMFQAFQQGSSVLNVFMKFIGAILTQLGEMCVTMGILEVVASFTLMGKLAGASTARGLALIVAGVAAIAAGVALGGVGASSSKASGSGAGTSSTTAEQKNQTVYMEPYFQRQQNAYFDKLNNTVSKLDNTLNRLDTKSPGVIVMEGARSASKVLTKSIDRQLQTDQSARASFSKTVLGET